jgi:hypothetical protein
MGSRSLSEIELAILADSALGSTSISLRRSIGFDS